jgi:CDP-paratose 2-epimerase
MSVVLVTGSGGLVGSETVRHYLALGYEVVGVDNDMRRYFFGPGASVAWNIQELRGRPGYDHHDFDVRDEAAVSGLLRRYAGDVALVVHAAAQPSHDWAAQEPLTDFDINARSTLLLLEACRRFCPDAPFIYLSTNKVYGDRPNSLPLVELETRWEVEPGSRYAAGIGEDFPIDATMHSVFGASKAAADIMVQEYGRYFGMFTACFRGGCLTGPAHSGAPLHGFLGYLVRCCVTGVEYEVIGYKGKQVRDNIHSHDLVRAFEAFRAAPRRGEVYNIGGARPNSCSILEAVALCREIVGRDMKLRYNDQPRRGDHIWWITDVQRFRSHYPAWAIQKDLHATLREMAEAVTARTAGA